MTQLVFIALVLAQVTIFAVITTEVPGDPTGDPGTFQCEEKKAAFTDCATDCDLDKCPVDEHYSKICERKECKPGCRCGFNEKFAKNGTCIATQLCPPFHCENPNEEFVACPSYCSDACSQGCPQFGVMLMVVECIPACRCKEGFSRKDGVCVPRDKC